MTAGTHTGDGLRCHNCAHHARPGDRFCEQCGSALGVLPARRQPAAGDGQPQVRQGPTGGAPTGPISDETTRYLCAAAHLDEDFCNAATAEFLVESVRAIPPSPGVNSAVVLREVVAAQTRRRIRDGLLLALLFVLASVNLMFVINWAVLVGLAIALSALGRNRRRMTAALLALGGSSNRNMVTDATGRPVSGAIGNRRIPVWMAIALGVLLFLQLLQQLILNLTVFQGSERSFIVDLLYPSMIWPTFLIGILMLVVLIVDEFTVAKLKRSSFRRDLFDPDPRRAPSGWERRVRSLGGNTFRAMLDRVARADESLQIVGEQADVIVHRGHKPFIGAGLPVHHQFIALPLEPSKDDSEAVPDPISVTDLHRHVAEAAAALRSPSSLGPGRRLEQLRYREQVLMPADRLLFNLFNQMQPPVLPDLSRPPLAHLPLGAARHLAENPLEWARYYSCFRVESWDRDLTTSCYLQIGTDQRMLYLEWTYCTLFPVDEKYRIIDHFPESAWRNLGRSILELVVLPASVSRRFRSVLPRNTALVQRPGDVIPARYGAGQSLRELAADTNAQNYFQDTDTERYINIMDGALFRAVGRYLEKQGYSVVEFMRQAESVSNTFNINAPVTGSAIAVNSTMKNVQTTTA